MTRSTIRRTLRPASAARRILDCITGDDPTLRRSIAVAGEHMHVAEELFAARTAASLSHAQLARLAGTTAGAIKRLEDADLGRHSVAVLERVAAALGLRLEIRFVEQRRRARRA